MAGFLKSLFGGSRKAKVAEFMKMKEEADAKVIAKAALVNGADSEAGRAAGDAKRRRLANARSLGNASMGKGGNAQLLLKTLMGQ